MSFGDIHRIERCVREQQSAGDRSSSMRLSLPFDRHPRSPLNHHRNRQLNQQRTVRPFPLIDAESSQSTAKLTANCSSSRISILLASTSNRLSTIRLRENLEYCCSGAVAYWENRIYSKQRSRETCWFVRHSVRPIVRPSVRPIVRPSACLSIGKPVSQ